MLFDWVWIIFTSFENNKIRKSKQKLLIKMFVITNFVLKCLNFEINSWLMKIINLKLWKILMKFLNVFVFVKINE